MGKEERLHKRYMKFGHKFLKKGNIDYAIKYFIKGMERFPRDGGFFIGASFCFMLRGETDFAIANLKKAIAINPFDPVGYLAIIECFIGMKEYYEAFVYYHHIDSSLLNTLELKADYDHFTEFFEGAGFKFGEKVSDDQKMRMMYDELIRFGLESGKLSEGYIEKLEQKLGNVTDHLMNTKDDISSVKLNILYEK